MKSTVPKKLATTPNKYNSKSSAFNLKPALPDGLFYHPSPSPMNPEITPKAFLPESDPRKTSDLYYPEEEQLIKDNIQYMPIIYQGATPKSYKLTKDDVAELQKMRDSGATRKQMKEKFPVTDHFINIATDANPETLAAERKQLKRVVKRWSSKKKHARVLREERKLALERGL